VRTGLLASLAVLLWFALAAALGAAPPLMIVAPAAPGGGWDQTARVLQQALAAVEPGASVQVDNVPGAAGTIGRARFVSSERGNPDALLVTGLVMLSAITMNRAPVTLAETSPIARLTGEPEVIVVPAASAIRTLEDLVASFTASPGSIAWGGGSAGGTDELLVRLLAERVGVRPAEAVYIAFAGGGPALAALLGGQVTVGVSGYSEFAGQIEAGTLRPLALSAPSTAVQVEIPTLRQLGVDLELSNWRGIVAAPGLSDAERDGLVARIERVATSDAWRALLVRHGWDDQWLAGPAFRQFLIAEQQRVDGVLRQLAASGAAGVRATPWVTSMTAPALSLIAVALLTGIVASQRRGTPGTTTAPDRRRLWWLIGALIAHALTFTMLGFVPTSTALFLVAARLSGSRRWRRDIAIGLATALLLFAVFTYGLGLTLPADPISRWIRG
jgi:putative tricarboxylic transport membrane protein